MTFALLLSLLLMFCGPSEVRAQQSHLHSGAGVSATQLPFWTAKHLGIFAKHGLNVELIAISSGARGMQALLGGSTDSPIWLQCHPFEPSWEAGTLLSLPGI
jgi:ABC-type nitrate/sulfonate/bicarbonate transport system substrate-binding protein